MRPVLWKKTTSLSVFLVSCSVVSPPPIAPIMATPAPDPLDTVTISFAAGFTGGVWSDDAVGGELRLSWQDSSNRAMGIALAGGLDLSSRQGSPCPPPLEPWMGQPAPPRHFEWPKSCGPAWVISVRAFRLVQQAGDDNIAYRGGAGLGLTERGLLYATVDANLIAGTTNGTFDGYISPTAALSVPILRGKPITLTGANAGRRPKVTGYLGVEGGAVGLADEQQGGALEVMWLVGVSPDDSLVQLGAAVGGLLRSSP